MYQYMESLFRISSYLFTLIKRVSEKVLLYIKKNKKMKRERKRKKKKRKGKKEERIKQRKGGGYRSLKCI